MRTKKINWHKTGRVLGVVAVITMMMLVFAPPVFAGVGIEGDPNVYIGPDEVIDDDLFVTGQTVRIEGRIEGDLFASGQQVIISGEVMGNVFAGGQEVIISGYVNGAVLVGAYSLEIDKEALITRNVYFGGFSLTTGADAVIGRSVYAGGYQVVLDGEVSRDVTAGVAAFEVNGHIGGDVDVEVGEPTDTSQMDFQPWVPGVSIDIVEPGFRVPDDAVDGEVNYHVTPVETDVTVDVPHVQIDPAWVALRAMRQRAGEFIAILLVGGLALLLMKNWLLKAVGEIKANAAADTGWGLLVVLLVVPAASVLFFLLLVLIIFVSLLTLGNLTGTLITLSGVTFTGVLAVFGLLAGLGSKIVVGYLVGRWLLEKLTKLSFEGYWHHFAALATGAFLYEVVRAIPVFGFFAMLVVVLIGTGAFFVLIRDSLRKPAPIQPELLPS